MSTDPGPMDFTFTAPIGVSVKGEMWSCVEVPDSVEMFGTGKSVRVVAAASPSARRCTSRPVISTGRAATD